jgi:hypothetical protein
MGTDPQELGGRKNVKKQAKDYDTHKLRGYCRICNRYYFFRNSVNTESVQFHQHHSGVCQSCRYICARIKAGAGS